MTSHITLWHYNLQSFWNLEAKDAGLKIQVVGICTCIESACFRQNMEVGGTGLEIQVATSYTCIKSVYAMLAVSRVLGVLVLSKAWEYTCNHLKSWN